MKQGSFRPVSALKHQAKSQSRTKTSSAKKNVINKPKSCLRIFVEFLFVIVWILFTCFMGYFVGYNRTSSLSCPSAMPAGIKSDLKSPPENLVTVVEKPCESNSASLQSSTGPPPLFKEGGFTFDEIKSMWQCSHAESDINEANKKIFPEKMEMGKTKWKSIITVDPKIFFDKYLTQYPSDTKAAQPVIVFSHNKTLETFDQLSDVCKVIDIAVIPDKKGLCVSVAETYHDTASYHILHSDRQSDGSFAAAGSTVAAESLPSEKSYAAARALLLDFFTFGDAVQKAVNGAVRLKGEEVSVGCFVDDASDLELYLNSVESAKKVGIKVKTKFTVFTTSRVVSHDMAKTGIKTIVLSELAEVGTKEDGNIGAKMRRYFIQAWLAFAVANGHNKMLWQSPGTIWLGDPDLLWKPTPQVESLWAYTGRRDKKAAPFFVSFDFFSVAAEDRPIHLLHEIVLHFDLVLTWGSLDAVAAYRLSENNSRYGTTMSILPPMTVLHADLLGFDPAKIKSAVSSTTSSTASPLVALVLPVDFNDPGKIKKILEEAGLWFSELNL